MGTLLEQDKYRYAVEKMPRFQRLFRCCQECRFKPMQLVYRLLFRWCRQRNFIELSHQTVIGGGLYIGHPYCITINPQAIIGRNVNIHRGVVIGQENRGKREGAPTIGDDVWIGINASILALSSIRIMPPRDISIIKVSDVVLQKAGHEMEAHNSIRRYLHRIGEEIQSTAEIAKLTSWPAAVETLIAKADIQIMCRNGYNERHYESLIADSSLFKLTWKQEFPIEINGVETYYGKLLNGNLRRN